VPLIPIEQPPSGYDEGLVAEYVRERLCTIDELVEAVDPETIPQTRRAVFAVEPISSVAPRRQGQHEGKGRHVDYDCQVSVLLTMASATRKGAAVITERRPLHSLAAKIEDVICDQTAIDASSYGISGTQGGIVQVLLATKTFGTGPEGQALMRARLVFDVHFQRVSRGLSS